MNTKYWNILQIIPRLPQDIPFEFIELIGSWDKIVKSPYGDSYYDKPKGWDFTHDGTLRIADHWNFESHLKLHCQTSTPVENKTHWTLAKYDESLKRFVVIKSIPKPKTSVKATHEFRLYHLLLIKEKAIENLKMSTLYNTRLFGEAFKKLELRFLNKYFKTLEEAL